MYSVQIIPQNLKMVEFLANAAELTSSPDRIIDGTLHTVSIGQGHEDWCKSFVGGKLVEYDDVSQAPSFAPNPQPVG